MNTYLVIIIYILMAIHVGVKEKESVADSQLINAEAYGIFCGIFWPLPLIWRIIKAVFFLKW